MVLVKVAGISKSSFWTRKLKAPEGRNLPRVLHTIRDTAGNGSWSPDSQCRDLAHLAHLCSKYLWSSYCAHLRITVVNVELMV